MNRALEGYCSNTFLVYPRWTHFKCSQYNTGFSLNSGHGLKSNIFDAVNFTHMVEDCTP